MVWAIGFAIILYDLVVLVVLVLLKSQVGEIVNEKDSELGVILCG